VAIAPFEMNMKIALLLTVLLLVPVRAADPTTPVLWTAKQLAEVDARVHASVDPAGHIGIERLLDSASFIYRDGPSDAEVHQKLADFITVRSGAGEIVIGGTIVNARTSAPDELRGSGINGGTRYKFSAGDALYVPANTVHQFFVAPGRDFTVTIVKITPKQ
jgi:mannose-6-phosphate isomerase-like protein (cupin superfamily)